MTDTAALADLAFVGLAYGAILGALAGYAWSLARRLRRARRSATPDTAADPTG